jgi:hypothetical protein
MADGPEETALRDMVDRWVGEAEALGWKAVVMLSISAEDRTGYTLGAASESLSPAQETMLLGMCVVEAEDEMEKLHPAALLEAREADGNA